MNAARLVIALVVSAGLLLWGCKHLPTEKERQTAQIHYDLGVEAQRTGDIQTAMREYNEALRLDPTFPEPYNARAILLHLSYGKLDEAIGDYKKALELRPAFSEAKTNLANVYLDQARYPEATTLYEEALNDMLYRTPFIAHGNLGWARYKSGDVTAALEHIQTAITLNPKFCQGYKNLGIISDERGQVAEACKHFSKYRENCPEVADAYYREGLCLAKAGDSVLAKKSFETCAEKASSDALKEDCRRLGGQVQ